MTNGSITINGITDPELLLILETKLKHEGHFFFTPQSMQPQNTQPQQYNNVTFTWGGDAGLQAVHELTEKLAKKERQASGQ